MTGNASPGEFSNGRLSQTWAEGHAAGVEQERHAHQLVRHYVADQLDGLAGHPHQADELARLARVLRGDYAVHVDPDAARRALGLIGGDPS